LKKKKTIASQIHFEFQHFLPNVFPIGSIEGKSLEPLHAAQFLRVTTAQLGRAEARAGLGVAAATNIYAWQ